MELLAQRQEKPMDFLEPFLEQLQIGDAKLTRQQAIKLHDDCLADLKQRLVDQANLIQASFDKVCQWDYVLASVPATLLQKLSMNFHEFLKRRVDLETTNRQLEFRSD